jgi:hypothetical protein
MFCNYHDSSVSIGGSRDGQELTTGVNSQTDPLLKTFVEEAAALASITLFVGMIAVWAQLIPQL